MSHLGSASAASETPGVAVPNKLQVAAASAAPILTSLSAMSVTPAAAAAEIRGRRWCLPC